jgi:polar amino acid transport system substrate-binding protein
VNPDDACGKIVAVQKATVQDEDIQARNSACTRAGKPAIDIQSYELQTQATAAVVGGKADAMLADSPVVAYAIQQNVNKLEQIGEIYDSAPYGVVVAKSDTQFAEAIKGAVDALIADGTYTQILEKWNVQQGAVTQAEVNPAVEPAS